MPRLEKAGEHLFATFAGMVMIASGKQLYAATLKPVKQRRFRRPVAVSFPQAAGRLHRGTPEES